MKKHIAIFAVVLCTVSVISFGAGYYTYALQVQRLMQRAGL